MMNKTGCSRETFFKTALAGETGLTTWSAMAILVILMQLFYMPTAYGQSDMQRQKISINFDWLFRMEDEVYKVPSAY